MKKRNWIIQLTFVLCLLVNTISIHAEGNSNQSDENDDGSQLLDELEINPEITRSPENDIQENNSIAMLNYLTVLSQEINSSNNSRLFLEEAYSSIINDTYPNAVDNRTKIQLENLLDIIESFRMVDVKRERLNYLYQQNQAQAMRAAIPSPLAILNVVQSFDLKRIIISGLYLAIDSVTSYNAYKNQLELQYLQDGWALDDEESKTVADNRKDAFLYMIDIVNANNLPGEYALNEESVADLVKWKNNPNVTSRIQFLEDNQKTYEKYGGYWLILAESYFEKDNYESCLNAIEKYEEVQGRIFRIDHEYARILPYAIVSVQNVETDASERVKKIEFYIEQLISNTKGDDWALRYFAAQSYLSLCNETFSAATKKEYKEKAYIIARSNVNYLVDNQISKNQTYMADIVEKKASENASKEEKKEIKEYNKLLKNERKIALPPVSEPLLLNCDLLFALAEELNNDAKEKQKIDEILHQNNEPLFLNEILDSKYWFNNENVISLENITLSDKNLQISADYLADDYKINLRINDGTDEVVIDDWIIEKVDRADKNNIRSFNAVLTSDTFKKYKFKVGDTLKVEIIATETVDCDPVIVEYKAVEKKVLGFISSVKIEKVE